jgi:hypothetical protein
VKVETKTVRTFEAGDVLMSTSGYNTEWVAVRQSDGLWKNTFSQYTYTDEEMDKAMDSGNWEFIMNLHQRDN